MNRWLRRILILAAVVAVIVVLRLTVFRPEPVPVTVHEVGRGRVEDTVVNSRAGTIKSRLRSGMSPGISGLVAAIPVEKGQAVKKGQPLLRLDDSELRAQVDLAARSLDAARATAEQACLTAEQAGRERTRAEGLSERGLLSVQVLEKAVTEADAAAAACHAAREQANQARAALTAARAILAKTVITAPFDGVVLDVTTEVGEWISPSPPGVFIPPVVDLIDPGSRYVSAPLDEADVERVRLGLPARITMDAYRNREFPAVITYVSSFVETRQEQNRTLTVEAEFEAAELPANLLPGLSADIKVILAAHDDVIRIPTYSLLEGNRVLVVASNELEEKTVETGLRNWEFTEILSGLSEGDQVVVSLDRAEVTAGAKVEVEAEAEPVITLTGISRTFQVGGRPVHALREVDLDVPGGEYVSIMGPSGSGKSTLLNILGCLDRPSAGSYRLDEEETSRLSETQLSRIRRHKIGFVFQFFHLVPRLTAAENIELPMIFAGAEAAERRQRIARALDQVGLEERADHRPDQLSGGERQRVAIARAVVMEPAILLADEPTGNLDSGSGSEIVELIERMNAEGLTLVVVTHDPEIGRRAGRRIRLADGKVVSDDRNGGGGGAR